jgi:hypothetical protein
MLGKTLILGLLVLFLVASPAMAEDINISVNVTQQAPMPAPSTVFTVRLATIVMGAGGLLFLVGALIPEEENPFDRMKMFIAMVIIMLVIIGAISQIGGLI